MVLNTWSDWYIYGNMCSYVDKEYIQQYIIGLWTSRQKVSASTCTCYPDTAACNGAAGRSQLLAEADATSRPNRCRYLGCGQLLALPVNGRKRDLMDTEIQSGKNLAAAHPTATVLLNGL